MKRKLLTALLALGTGLGAVLAGSWQFTLLAAVILWLPCLALSVGKVRGLRKKKAVSSTAETQETGEALEPTELIEPRGGASDETELLEETDLLEATDATESPDLLIEPRKPLDQAETEIVLELEPTEPLSLIKPEESPAEEAETESPAPKTPPLVCPNCGHPVAGKRFCAKCGTRVGE